MIFKTELIMKMLRSLFVIVVVSCAVSASGARIDTVSTFSVSMKKEIKAVVVTPDSYKPSEKLPVVYLLHGYGDSYAGGWLQKGKGFETLADEHHLIIVCPDGGVSSWYFDSPVDSAFRYETYIVKELIPFIDSHYATVAERWGRAITGLSMGGHGALYLAIRHQNLFGAAGSMSGGVDIRPFPNNWDIAKRLGDYSKYPENWEKNTVVNMVSQLQPGVLSLIIDCGTEDFFYKVNCQLHERLLENHIPHDFIARPGAHTWDYWKNSIRFQMLFMHLFFEKNKR
jgi:S-formylglutathione hydrolase FrmB